MDEPEDSKGHYTLGFVTDEAYEQFAEADCPELRRITDELRLDPFPEDDDVMKCHIPNGGDGHYFVAWLFENGRLYKVAYGVKWQPRRVGITAVSVQNLPEFDFGGQL